MTKNDNAHSVRMINSLRKYIGNDVADEFEEKYPLSKAANIEKKYEWAKNVCHDLEEHYDTETIMTIRKECRCNDGKSIANKILKYVNKADNTEQFVKAFNENETFASLEYISDNKEKKMKNYKKTKLACYLGFITQAVAANFAPLLFLKFHTDYNISLGNIAMISTSFFFTQLLVDLFCAKYVDRIGYRVCIVASEVCSAAGLVGLAFLPEIMPSPFVGIILSVILYAIGSGLIEVLGSPIVEACPFENKEATMSLLHSFYCWGSVGTILVSTVFFLLFGIDSWKWLAVIFALIPAINIYNFATCPIESLVEEGQGMGIRKLFSNPMFLVAIVMMVCSGASELAMAQWASAYAESALGFSKTVGDIAGPCMFAVTMGISRVLFGKAGDKMNLNRFMIGSGILCFVCYLFASFSENPIIGLAGCIVCGFSVGIMWPGTISISSKAFPTGGTAMFALLAMAGDLGGSIGPAIVGRVADMFGGSIHVGMRIGLLFPITLCFMLFLFNILNHNENRQTQSKL